MHRKIKIRLMDHFCFNISRTSAGFCITKACWKRKDKFDKLYDKAYKQIQNELDLKRLMKNMRNLKLVMKNSMLTPEVKYQLAHMEKNVLNVDTTSEESFEDNGTVENEMQQDQYVMVNDNTQLDMTKTSARMELDTDEGTVRGGKRTNRLSRKDKKRFSAEKLKN